MTIQRPLSPEQVVQHEPVHRSKSQNDLTEISPGMSLKIPPRRRSVQFLSADSIKTDYIESSYEICEVTKTFLWWTPEEYEENRMERNDLVSQYTSDPSSKNDAEEGEDNDFLAPIFKHCMEMNSSQVMRSKTTKQLLAEVSKTEGLRGLERKLSRTVSRQRKHHVRSMIHMHRQTEVTEEALSVTSAHSSRPSQILARVFAGIDAKQAAI